MSPCTCRVNGIYPYVCYVNDPVLRGILRIDQHQLKTNPVMATKELWINLPIRDVARSRAFFKAMGFTFNPMFEQSDQFVSLLVGEKQTGVMMFPEEVFRNFAGQAASDTSLGSEVLISIDAASPAEVDELAARATAAGGTVYAAPGESQGWMYGCGFVDPDGHRWNVLYMDMSRMPGQQG